MSPPAGGEPSLLQVMYDSLNEIKSAVADVSKNQSQLSTNVALAMQTNAETQRTQASMQKQVDEVEGTVTKLSDTISELKRTAWLLTIVGAIVVAIVTTVVGDWVSAKVNKEAKDPTHHPTTQQPR